MGDKLTYFKFTFEKNEKMGEQLTYYKFLRFSSTIKRDTWELFNTSSAVLYINVR